MYACHESDLVAKERSTRSFYVCLRAKRFDLTTGKIDESCFLFCGMTLVRPCIPSGGNSSSSEVEPSSLRSDQFSDLMVSLAYEGNNPGLTNIALHTGVSPTFSRVNSNCIWPIQYVPLSFVSKSQGSPGSSNGCELHLSTKELFNS